MFSNLTANAPHVEGSRQVFVMEVWCSFDHSVHDSSLRLHSSDINAACSRLYLAAWVTSIGWCWVVCTWQGSPTKKYFLCRCSHHISMLLFAPWDVVGYHERARVKTEVCAVYYLYAIYKSKYNRGFMLALVNLEARSPGLAGAFLLLCTCRYFDFVPSQNAHVKGMVWYFLKTFTELPHLKKEKRFHSCQYSKYEATQLNSLLDRARLAVYPHFQPLC